MFSIGEVSRISGVTVRTLRLYDRMGLLPPTQVTRAGYRMYDEGSLARLKEILVWRELEFPLKEIACCWKRAKPFRRWRRRLRCWRPGGSIWKICCFSQKEFEDWE